MAMSWQQLLDIAAEARQLAEMERNVGPLACPNDGQPLMQNSAGEWHCPFDGFTWPY